MGLCTWLFKVWLGWFCYKKVCYDGLGCFENKSPFHNANFEVPQSPDEIQVQFFLYTTNDTDIAYNLKSNVSDIDLSGYSASDRTIFLIHGFTGSSRDNWIMTAKDAILSVENANVVLVDWEKGADNLLDYNQAAANCRVVGAIIARLMTSLHTSTGASFGNMYVIGHSLGAHIAGYAGEKINSLGRITGLDPAYLSFSKKNPSIRLDSSDAKYVDVIHTDGKRWLSGLGIADRLGHADFFPNGGSDQPGCPSFFGYSTCDHSRARSYFVESINSTCRFNAVPCSNWGRFKRGKCSCDTNCAVMGFSKNNTKFSGKFYLKTRKQRPFCKE